MNGKKTLPLLVIASMLLSLIPSVMFANAVLTAPSVTPGNGVKGDTIVVIGPTGEVPAGTTVNLYWDDSTIAWNGVKGLLNSTTAAADGSYEVWFDVPEATGGDHYLWVKTTTGGISDVVSVVFVVDPEIKLSPSAGLPGDSVTATIYGYGKTKKIQFAFDGDPAGSLGTSNSIGTASVSFKVPDVAYATYPVTANATVATTNFVVGPVITVTPASGTVGSVVAIAGRGFTVGKTIVQYGVSIDGTTCYITTTLPITVDATGRIRLNAVIPQVADKDDYVITVTTSDTLQSATADFEVTGLAKVSVTPEWGPQASTITVTGVNYPKISGTEVDVTLGGVDLGVAKTLADGSFSKTFKVPAIADGAVDVIAEAADYNIADDAAFKVGTMNIILSDDTGVTGETIGLTGNGFTFGGAYNVTIGSKTLVDGENANGAGLISTNFMVPQMAVGTYTVTVWDIDAEISLTTTFQVTATTTVTIDVPTAPVDFEVEMIGSGFADTGYGNVNFVIYNKTSTGALDFWWTMDVVNGVTNSSGEFDATWVVSDVLSKGSYIINITDPQDYMVQLPFTVGDTHIVAAARKDTFKVGETISFILEHSFGNEYPVDESVLKIYNPSGALVFSGDPLETWTKTGLWYTAPYSSQTAGGNPMTLEDDAPLGTWSWKWVDGEGDNIKTGTFTVVASDAAQVDAKITALATQITALQTAVSTAVAGAQTAATQAGTKADAATAAATAAGAKADAATAAATAAGTKADAAATAAASAAASAKSAADGVSGLTTLVYAAIGASLIAALAAIVALMQISRKIA